MQSNDEDWFEALAGKNTKENGDVDVIMAKSIRRALITRRNQIQIDIDNYDQRKLQKITDTLVFNGLLKKEKKSTFLKKEIKIIISFIFGSITSTLLIFGLSSQMLVTTRGGNNNDSLSSKELINSEDTKEAVTHIVLQSSDPKSLAQALEAKAWECGAGTGARMESEKLVLKINNLPSNAATCNELKLMIGVNPSTSGKYVIEIAK
jgi:hypothetical protein